MRNSERVFLDNERESIGVEKSVKREVMRSGRILQFFHL